MFRIIRWACIRQSAKEHLIKKIEQNTANFDRGIWRSGHLFLENDRVCGRASRKQITCCLPTPNARGTANCSVILSDDAIGSPIVHDRVLIAMNMPSFLAYQASVRTARNHL
jgi:hypothetical protein